MDNIDYIECDCTTVEHTLRFAWFNGDDWYEKGETHHLYVETHLTQFLSWYKRLWYGIKYICGKQSRYGCFGETLLEEQQVTRLRDLCNRWIKTHGKNIDEESHQKGQ